MNLRGYDKSAAAGMTNFRAGMNQRKVIALTGCSRGLGRALVKPFIDAGHHVFGAARAQLEIDALNKSYGDNALFSVVDVADEVSVERWCAKVLEHCDAPDLLINNAGLINEPAPLWQVPASEFRQVIDVNLLGVHHVIRHFLPAMLDNGSGLVVNLSSGWGRSVSADVAPYCASKWAIEGMTKALAAELPKGVGALALNPGVIDTDMLRAVWGDEAAAFDSADAWAKSAAPFILSLGAQHNGQSLTVA